MKNLSIKMLIRANDIVQSWNICKEKLFPFISNGKGFPIFMVKKKKNFCHIIHV